MNWLFVGGMFDDVGGRASGYFGKLWQAVAALYPGANTFVVNGGKFSKLADLATYKATHIVWMVDVSNEYEKLLPSIMEANPGAVLIQSKSNIGGRYSREQLFARMRASGAEMLIEFDRGCVGHITAGLLSVSGRYIGYSGSDIGNLAADIGIEVDRIGSLLYPLRREKKLLPVKDHPGAFGVVRKNHVHEGVDLYGEVGESVDAMETGIVVGLYQFTGEDVGSPWWNDTFCVLVAGESGVINYGEIHPWSPDWVKVGDTIERGAQVGTLLSVLKKDKGKPMTMLHIERYVIGTKRHIDSWDLDKVWPAKLLDPTVLLRSAML
jgi:hypothetical protein